MILLANFTVPDPLDHTMFRCFSVSPVWLDRDGEHTSTCSRAQDHKRRGSPIHRAVRVDADGKQKDVYWL